MYLALYRKYRPATFGEMIGQEYIIKTLRHQVGSGRISHAYLFCGLRGTGKTSAAKIFARAINCLNAAQTGGEPCGTCRVCKALSQENNLDIIEIDAASNNGVDEIRALRDKVIYPPHHGKYKVYIIDEAHMMTGSAFNALLKTLEEPPEHAVFVLATTEAQKLPATILSRCQRFDFKHIPDRQIVGRLKAVLDDLNVTYDDEALKLIARVAEGGMRDALSMADMCLAYLEDGHAHLSYDDALSVLGALDRTFLFHMTDALIALDAAGCLKCVDTLVNDGKSIAFFIRDLMTHLRDVLLVKACNTDCRTLINCSEETYLQLEKQARSADKASLIRALDILTETESGLKLHARPRIMLELALLRICRPADELSFDALDARLAALEKAVKDSVPAPVQKAKQAPRNEEKEIKKELPAVQKPAISVADAEVYTELLKIIRKERLALTALLRDCNGGGIKGTAFTLEFPPESDIFIDALMRPNNKTYIEQTLLNITGKELTLRCAKGSENASPLEQVLKIFSPQEEEKEALPGALETELVEEPDEYDEFVEDDDYNNDIEEGE